MKFGVFDHMDKSAMSLADQYDSRLRLAQAYDRAGFHAYHLAEHHSTPLGVTPSPSVYLAAVIQRTQRLRVGPMVYTLSMHHPLRVLEEICMLDQMSRGRLEVGLGRGVSPYEIRYYGVDPEQAQSIYQESYQIIMQGLTEAEVNFSGRHFQLQHVPVEMQCYQKPMPPIWYGLGTPQGARWVAENRINIICNGTVPHVRAITDSYRQAWRDLRRDAQSLPLMGVSRHIVIGDSRRAAQESAAQAYKLWHRHLLHLWVKHGARSASLPFPEEFEAAQEAGLAMAGTADEVRDWVEAQVESMGVNYFVCRFAFGSMSHEDSLRTVELFASEVAPALQEKVQ